MCTRIAIARANLFGSRPVISAQKGLVKSFQTSSSSSTKGILLTTSARSVVTSARGEFLAEPVKVRFGVVKILATAIPGILLGATMAKNGATWLEENEIFIPDDDDDD